LSLKLVTGLIVAAVGATLFLAACGDDGATPEETLCNELERLEMEAETLRDLDFATVPLSELQDQLEEVRNAFAAVQEARGGVGQARVEDLESALQGLTTTIADIDADFSIEQAADAIRSAAQDIEDAWAALGTDANCPQS
jgi:DNA repair ATPase RecN